MLKISSCGVKHISSKWNKTSVMNPRHEQGFNYETSRYEQDIPENYNSSRQGLDNETLQVVRKLHAQVVRQIWKEGFLHEIYNHASEGDSVYQGKFPDPQRIVQMLFTGEDDYFNILKQVANNQLPLDNAVQSAKQSILRIMGGGFAASSISPQEEGMTWTVKNAPNPEIDETPTNYLDRAEQTEYRPRRIF